MIWKRAPLCKDRKHTISSCRLGKMQQQHARSITVPIFFYCAKKRKCLKERACFSSAQNHTTNYCLGMCTTVYLFLCPMYGDHFQNVTICMLNYLNTATDDKTECCCVNGTQILSGELLKTPQEGSLSCTCLLRPCVHVFSHHYDADIMLCSLFCTSQHGSNINNSATMMHREFFS